MSATEKSLENGTDEKGIVALHEFPNTDASANTPETSLAPTPTQSDQTTPTDERGSRFWLVIGTLCVTTFLAALDLTAVSTAIPTIIRELHGTDFSWIGSAYALAATAWLPWTGGLANIFGRRAIMLFSISMFLIGSAVCGSAHSMNTMIIGRTFQGVGGGGILSVTSQVITDLVPLADRGKFVGILGGVWALAAAVGPLIGGLTAQKSWRWLFYLNLPVCVIASVLVFVFMHLKVPEDTLRNKIKRIDGLGNLVFIGSTTSAVIALSWAGVNYSWGSSHILAPLIIGLAGMISYVLIEMYLVEYPTVPVRDFANRTTLLGFTNTFLHGLMFTALVYYFPVYTQGCLGYGPILAGVAGFPCSLMTAPMSFTSGAIISKTGKYKEMNIFAWAMCVLSSGLFTYLKADSPKVTWIMFQFIFGLGMPFLFTALIFPVTAPLPPALQARAMASFAFFRSFGQIWGITIGATITQNQLLKNLPKSFSSQFSNKSGIAYESLTTIKHLPEPLRTQIRVAFADALRVLWYTLVGITALGFFLSFFYKVYPLHKVTDTQYGLKERPKKTAERGEEAKP